MPTISDDEAALAVKAVEHYDAYLKVSRREDGAYKALAERLKRKPVEPDCLCGQHNYLHIAPLPFVLQLTELVPSKAG